MATNNIMKKYMSIAKWFIQAHDLEAQAEKWQDGEFVLAFTRGEDNRYYSQADGYEYIIPRRMEVREFVTLASLGKILTREEVNSLYDEIGCLRTMGHFVF